jgi:hypothetical protein
MAAIFRINNAKAYFVDDAKFSIHQTKSVKSLNRVLLKCVKDKALQIIITDKVLPLVAGLLFSQRLDTGSVIIR